MDDSRSTSSLTWLGWAIYLACSWTWCIGMFLPVLLVRDYGVWGWIVFAIPNVIGAAAMGWIIALPGQSEAVTSAHGRASFWFSTVTLAFHAYFALAVMDNLFGPLGSLGAFAGCIAILSLVEWRSGYTIPASVFVLAVSLIAFAIALFARVGTWPPMQPPEGRPLLELAPLGAACVFGFALCPFLDRTFHHARQQLVDGRRTFGVGFGVLFLSMIVFSLYYSIALAPGAVSRGDSAPPMSGLLIWLVSAHMMVQVGFTCAMHANALSKQQGRALTMAILIMVSVSILARVVRTGSALGPIEVGYRIFMGFYALVFPAYVWLCMIPGRGRVPPDRQQIVVWAVAVILAAPMFWMGFIERQMVWVLPGLAIVLLARLLIPKKKLSTNEHE